MVLIKVRYDAYNRQFKLLDRDLAGALEDGSSYLLIADFSTDEIPAGDAETQPELALAGRS